MLVFMLISNGYVFSQIAQVLIAMKAKYHIHRLACCELAQAVL